MARALVLLLALTSCRTRLAEPLPPRPDAAPATDLGCPSVTECLAPGSPCRCADDCCGAGCVDGRCALDLPLDLATCGQNGCSCLGGFCGHDAICCDGLACVGHTCVACVSVGGACTQSTDCCGDPGCCLGGRCASDGRACQ